MDAFAEIQSRLIESAMAPADLRIALRILRDVEEQATAEQGDPGDPPGERP